MEQAAISLSREPKHAPNRSLVMVKSNADLEQERTDRAKAQEEQNKPFITGLAGALKSKWEMSRFARNSTEERIIDGLRRRNGEYSPDKLASIRAQGGSEIFMMLTSIKCRAAEAWIEDVLFPAGDKPWSLSSTPEPELPGELVEAIAQRVIAEAQQWEQEMGQYLPPQALQERAAEVRDQLLKKIQEQADAIAARMETKIDDQTLQGGWEKALREVIKDLVTFPAGILKGPTVRRRKTLEWVPDEAQGFVPKAGTDFQLEWARVAPFDFYPSPSSKGINDGYFFERHRLRRADLVAMKGVPGYNDGAIDLVLDQYGRGGLRQWLWRDQERAQLEGRPNEWLHNDDTIDAVQYWGSASGHILMDWGMDPSKIKNPNEEYEIEAWLIGSFVIRAVINEHPLGHRPYDRVCFEEIPGAFWGKGVPEIMADLQDICNAAARSLVNNMAIASGPQVEVHTDRIPIGENITAIAPWRIWQTLSDPHGGSRNPAVNFHDIPSNAPELLKVFEHFSSLADEYTGIPKYAYGEGGSGGAAGTASGLSMLMSSAARGIKAVIANLDGPIEGSIRRTYVFNMLYDKDPSIKGDLKVDAKGSTSLIAKEQQMVRRNEFLQQTNNPVDMSIIGAEGRAAMLREHVKSFDMPVDDVVPDRKTIIARAKADAAAMAGQAPGQEGSAALDPAGNPVAGQDQALFQQPPGQ